MNVGGKMAHLRSRILRADILKALSFSPLVGVMGQRQVGKTTILKTIVGDDYVSLDDDESRSIAQLKPKSFLNEFKKTTAIDECQLAPQLFPAFKLLIQNNKKPGQFLLSGSVRFTSKKSIEESLTGRIYNLELLPLTLYEIKGLSPVNYLQWFKNDLKTIQRQLTERKNLIEKSHKNEFLLRGGLPGICFLREESHRRGMFKSHIETLLQRDLRQIIQSTVPYESLFLLLQYLAENQGHPFILKEAAQFSRITQVTTKKIMEAFEGLFLIRRLMGFGRSKGFKNSPRFFLEDQGMAHYLSPVNKNNEFLRWIFSQTFGNIHYQFNNKYQLGYFESKYNHSVPIVYKINDEILGFLYEDSEAPSKNILKVAEEFIKEFSPKAKVIILGDYSKLSLFTKEILLCPIEWIS